MDVAAVAALVACDVALVAHDVCVDGVFVFVFLDLIVHAHIAKDVFVDVVFGDPEF